MVTVAQNFREGARLNNMAPSNTDDGITLLQQGIDSIWLNVAGTLRGDLAELLAWAKEDAQAAGDDWAASPLPAFDGSPLRVHASGVKYYDWFCRSDDLTIKIRKPGGRSPLPAVVVRVSALALWRLGGGGRVAVERAAEYVAGLFDGGCQITVSAVHLATDFQGWSLASADLAGVVMRADTKEVHYGEGDVIETVAAGRSDNLRVSLYHKSLQVQKKALGWVPALWEACDGYQADCPVWRLEYQYGREFLHERGIETLADLWPALAGLWAYGMDWFSFRVPNAGDLEHRYRWAITPAWAALATWREDNNAGELPRVKAVRPRLHRLYQGLAGYLASAMALTEDVHPLATLERALRDLERRKGAGALDQVLERKRLRYGAYVMSAG